VFDIPTPRDHGERIRNVPRPWVDSLRAGRQPLVSGEDARVAVEMMLGAYQSAREGRRVRFPLEA